MTPFLPSFLY
jgi:hypothetical protein